MKKIFSIIFIFLFLFVYTDFSSCSGESKVHYLGDGKVQLNQNGYYELLFSLKDSNKKPVPAKAKISIRIVNDKEKEVFNTQTEITEGDYGIWSSPLEGEKTYACVKIDKKNIAIGLARKGTLYFSVYNDMYFKFDEMSVPIYNLPVKNPSVIVPELPIKLIEYSENYSFDSNHNLVKTKEVSSAIEITNITCEFSDFLDSAQITFFGKKTNGKEQAYDLFTFDYRLKDSDGYVVKSGMVLLSDIYIGDKFKKEETVFGLNPGQKYYLDVKK